MTEPARKPETDRTADVAPASPAPASARDVPAFPGDGAVWEERLVEARKRREAALAARGGPPARPDAPPRSAAARPVVVVAPDAVDASPADATRAGSANPDASGFAGGVARRMRLPARRMALAAWLAGAAVLLLALGGAAGFLIGARATGTADTAVVAPPKPFTQTTDIVPVALSSAPRVEAPGDVRPGDGSASIVAAALVPSIAPNAAPHASPDPAPSVAAEVPATAAEIPVAPEAEAAAAGPSPAPSAIRLTVYAPTSVGGTARAAALAALDGAERTVGTPKTVDLTVTTTHLRYYHAADRDAAAAAAAALGAPLRDFTAYRPSPDEGLVEVWMAGTGGPSDDPVSAPVSTVARDMPAERPANLFGRIATALSGAGTEP